MHNFAGAAYLLSATVAGAAASMVGGPHDFTQKMTGGTPGYQHPCQVCHVPHNRSAGASPSDQPAWNHHPSLNSHYVTYEAGHSETFNSLGLTVSLGSSSIVCLSCHDGSMSVNQSYHMASPDGTPSYAPTFAIETSAPNAYAWSEPRGNGPYLGRNDLTHMHPVGVSYPAAARVDPTLFPAPAPDSSTPLAQMLRGPSQSLECDSCHDIHGVRGASGTTRSGLVVDLEGGALCTTCHRQ
jgi:predicted CXXCH cytochrome family protein